MNNKIIEWLLNNNCVMLGDGSIRTKNGDYVTLSTLDHEPIAEMIFKHKLTDLQSISGALSGTYGNSVGIGFNVEEQKWYGFTHRGYGSYGIGYVAEKGTIVTMSNIPNGVPVGFMCKTLEDCKRLAIATSDYLD